MKQTSYGKILAGAVCAARVLWASPARADMLSGGLLGSLFRGDAFTGPRVVDFLVVGLAVYFLFSRFLRRPPRDEGEGGGSPDRPGGASGPGRTDGPGPENSPASRSGPPAVPGRPPSGSDEAPQAPSGPRPHPQAEAYRAAEAAWDRLRSNPAPGPGPGAPLPDPASPAAPANGQDEFLSGAKAAYARIRQSLDKGDLEDVRQFADPVFFEILSREEAGKPHPGDLAILLVEAQKTGERTEGGVVTVDVTYNVLAKRAAAGDQDVRLKEVWCFSRAAADPGATWRLSGLSQA